MKTESTIIDIRLGFYQVSQNNDPINGCWAVPETLDSVIDSLID